MKSKSSQSNLCFNTSKDNYSHIISENTLLPILVSSPIVNNRLSDYRIKLIQSKIKETVEHNLKKEGDYTIIIIICVILIHQIANGLLNNSKIKENRSFEWD